MVELDFENNKKIEVVNWVIKEMWERHRGMEEREIKRRWKRNYKREERLFSNFKKTF